MGRRKVMDNGEYVHHGRLHIAVPLTSRTLCGRERRRKLVPVAPLADIPPERLCGQCALRLAGRARIL